MVARKSSAVVAPTRWLVLEDFVEEASTRGGGIGATLYGHVVDVVSTVLSSEPRISILVEFTCWLIPAASVLLEVRRF